MLTGKVLALEALPLTFQSTSTATTSTAQLIEASEVRGATNGWQAARALGMRPEQAELALQCARRISKERLLDGLTALQEADDRLKGGGSKEPRIVMEFLIWRLTGVQRVGAG